MQPHILILSLLLCLLCCSVPAQALEGPMDLDDIRFWAYQIQALTEPGAIDALAESSYDMLVLEPTRTDWSSDDRYFDTEGAIERLKQTPASDGVHRKLLIAYIDIGQAEDWRWYWTWSTDFTPGEPLPGDWPGYILEVDPDGWESNYVVKYWDPEWKDLVIWGVGEDPAQGRDWESIIDEVILSGFDGIYLDWVEGFENDKVMAAAQADGVDPAEEMITFIAEMREYAQERNPDFLIIQQNAAALLLGREHLVEYIDGIAQEHVFFDGIATDDWDEPQGYDTPTESDQSREYVEYLHMYLDLGIPVFNAEYALEHADEAYERSLAEGFVPFCSRRSLGELSDTPPPNLPE